MCGEPTATGRQDHLTVGLGALDHTVALEFDANGALAVEQDAAHQGLGEDLQIRALHRRMQIGACGAGAPAAAAGLLAPADAVASTRPQVVHVVAVFDAGLAAGRDDRGTERRLAVHKRGKERAVFAVDLPRRALPVPGLFEIGQHIIPRPAAIAELG
jgi:hypothetical protein